MAYDALADLELTIDAVDWRRLEADTSSGFQRVTTEIMLTGPAETDGRGRETVTGTGEDVTYDTDEQDAFQAADWTAFDLEGTYTFDGFSAHLESTDLFPGGDPERTDFLDYRRWAFESAGLDLALRQADTSLAAILQRPCEPVRFVTSTRLGEPPTTERLEALRDAVPDLEFKLDPTPEWTPSVIDAVAEFGGVRILDLKGQYEGTDVDVPGDPELYQQLAEPFPDAILEDPAITAETRPVLEVADVRERLSWDAPIHGIEDVRSLPWEPNWLNIKPSRFGTLESLLETIAYADDHEIRLYGGGQFELGVGRGQLQLLASLFYPDSPNDVAPRAYNQPSVGDGLPSSPLAVPEALSGHGSGPAGFRWE
ncbi:hypothetical protein OB919_01920 [Halobacteria archaeon AArc-curdl1]|uniref:Enolase n=1 Tax=Natronosalvus hydrolyticus TaxID=2979988 RepID=A0AAP3E4X3_9EURY|nr:hypothetical protein [Halobacteria archaeon AArc-curdl1]